MRMNLLIEGKQTCSRDDVGGKQERKRERGRERHRREREKDIDKETSLPPYHLMSPPSEQEAQSILSSVVGPLPLFRPLLEWAPSFQDPLSWSSSTSSLASLYFAFHLQGSILVQLLVLFGCPFWECVPGVCVGGSLCFFPLLSHLSVVVDLHLILFPDKIFYRSALDICFGKLLAILDVSLCHPPTFRSVK